MNEYICKKCGIKITQKDYPKLDDAFKVMLEHAKTKHGLNRWSTADWRSVGKPNK